MLGKEKCKYLREIRKKIALENDIRLVTDECTFKGECKGTCPKCEAEVRYLENELERRKKIGKFVTIAGLSLAGLTSGTLLASCGEEEGDVPAQYSGDETKLEQKKALYQSIMERLNQNSIVAEAGTTNQQYEFNFNVTKEGKIDKIVFLQENSPYEAEITALLQGIPEEELNTLQEDWLFPASYTIQEGGLVFNEMNIFRYSVSE